MRIDRIYRYPVKGLTAEALDETTVEAGGAIPWDRAFALAQGDAPFDPAAPTWIPKTNFMCLRSNAQIALLRASFDPKHARLTILGPDGDTINESTATEAGRDRIAAWLTAFLGTEARGTPRFHHVDGPDGKCWVFGDQRSPVISLINEASRADFEAQVGARRHRRRFRANIWFTGAPAWSEFGWEGREFMVGSARLRMTKRTVRCPATEVNPETGERDANPIAELKAAYGHADLGIHAEVVEGGHFALGDAIELLDL